MHQKAARDPADQLELIRHAARRFFASVAGHNEMRCTNLHPGLDLFILLTIFFVLGGCGGAGDSPQHKDGKPQGPNWVNARMAGDMHCC